MEYKNLKGNKKFNKFVIDVHTKFSFGFRYFYHKQYKNNLNKEELLPGTRRTVEDGNRGDYTLSDWYINAKYGSLEDEILNNKIFSLKLYQWNNTITKAKLKWDTLKNSNIVNTANWKWEKVYGIKRGTIITLQHIISLLLYTNWSELCFKFSSTYRQLTDNESVFCFT